MVSLFRHNIPAATLLQLLIEAGLFFFAVLIAVKLHRHAATLSEPAVFAPATLFACLMVCVNGAFGLYRRDQRLDFVNFVARSVVALFVGFVVSYVTFGVLPYGSSSTWCAITRPASAYSTVNQSASWKMLP